LLLFVRYCSTEEYEVIKQKIENCFQQSHIIHGTRKLYEFIPLSRHQLAMKLYSNSGQYKNKKMVKDEGELK